MCVWGGVWGGGGGRAAAKKVCLDWVMVGGRVGGALVRQADLLDRCPWLAIPDWAPPIDCMCWRVAQGWLASGGGRREGLKGVVVGVKLHVWRMAVVQNGAAAS